jgi:hypothetical protein
MNIELTVDEANALAQLLDAGVKAVGLQGVKAAAAILAKLEAAASSESEIIAPATAEVDA